MSDDQTPPGSSATIAALDQATVGQLIVDRYRLDKRIGSGGMGAVWRAHDLHLERDIALKLVGLAQPLARARFIREGKVAARLDHPGLCRVYDVGERRGIGHLVMELLEGETLYHRMLRPPPSMSWRLDLLAEVARAMAVAHGQSLVHRDLKPDNIFLDHGSGRERAVVIDFGLAFLDGAGGDLGRLTQSDITGGTPLYMAPEQARAQAIGAPADVYALGCVLFELCAGRPPFEGAAAAVMSRQVFATPPTLAELVPDIEPGIERLASDMLAKAPELRPTMAQVADRLEVLSASAAQPKRPRTSSPALRIHRALTRNLEAASALPIQPPIGAVITVGPVPDDILVAVAAAGMVARRATTVDDAAMLLRAERRALVLADLDDDELVVALCKLGRPVIAVADVGDLDRATRLARLGCTDVITRPIQAAVATRKILRTVRRMPTSQP